MILFYAAENTRAVDSLRRRLAPYKVSQCISIGAVEKRLRKPHHGVWVVLMILSNSEELDQIAAIYSLVRDVKLVLVLPVHDNAMVARAHKFCPRFIAFADNGCDHVGAVLEKMMRNSCKTTAS